jgi:hypothetical protein
VAWHWEAGQPQRQCCRPRRGRAGRRCRAPEALHHLPFPKRATLFDLTPSPPLRPSLPSATQAAAVANRLDVATLLLQEAGASARALALATNRYGQSALQIAARKGCSQMMQLLATAAA